MDLWMDREERAGVVSMATTNKNKNKKTRQTECVLKTVDTRKSSFSSNFQKISICFKNTTYPKSDFRGIFRKYLNEFF